MALKSTVFKAKLSISNTASHYYQDHQLTIARHPSETNERMMMRLLSFVLNAHEDLNFTKGLSTDEEPDLWQKNLVGDVLLWVEVGLPSEKRLLKACQQSREVKIYTYQGRLVAPWLEKIRPLMKRFEKLSIWDIDPKYSQALSELAERSIDIQCTVDEQNIWVSDGDSMLEIPYHSLQ